MGLSVPASRKAAAVAQPEVVEVARESARDEELRSAHRRVFGKILAARASGDGRAEVKVAVQELVDACEAYTLRAS
jgi:hypothetical protein